MAEVAGGGSSHLVGRVNRLRQGQAAVGMVYRVSPPCSVWRPFGCTSVGYFGLEICVREPWSVVHFMKNAFRKGLQMVIESFAVSSSRIGYARTRWGVGWP